jgi:hypothetical protein
VRWLEFAFVVLVALPLLGIIQSPRRTSAFVAFAGLALACGAALLIDNAAYQGADWHDFNAFNPIRIAFTDYGAQSHFAARPDLLARYGYSENDLSLLSNFYLIDPQIANPEILSEMLRELPKLFDPLQALGRAAASLSALFRVELIGLTLAALALFALNPTRTVLFSWLIFLAVLMGLGAMGRAGVTRIFYAPLILLVIGSLLNWRQLGWRRNAPIVLLSVASIANAAIVVVEAKRNLKQTRLVRQSLELLPAEPILAWGGSFPNQLAYPVLAVPPKLVMYALGTFSSAPYSNLAQAEQQGRSVLQLLKSGQTVQIVAGEKKMQLFAEYAKKRLQATPIIIRQKPIPRIPLYAVRLDIPPDTSTVSPQKRSVD